MTDLTRREALEAISRLGVAAMLPGVIAGCETAAGSREFQPRNADLIREENAKRGTREWMLGRTFVEPSTKYRSPRIEGYFDRAGARAGETIGLHLSTNPESKVSVRIYRSGY